MADPTIDVLKDHFRQLRLPTMGQEFETLARDAAATNQNGSSVLKCEAWDFSLFCRSRSFC